MTNGKNEPFASKTIIRGEVVDAEYIDLDYADWNNNPFLKTLPPRPDLNEIEEILLSVPNYNEDERQVDPRYKRFAVDKIDQVFVPNTIHVEIMDTVDYLIRKAYIGDRNPFSSKYPAYMSDQRERVSTYTPPAGTTIFGGSGNGKTYTIERILSWYPQAILHSNYDGFAFTKTQLLYVYVECPPNGSIRDLCISIFVEIDSVLGTNYLSEAANGGEGNEDVLMANLRDIARHVNLGPIIIDETQRLYAIKSHNRVQKGNRIVDLFIEDLVRFENSVGSPLIFIGTMPAKDVLERKFHSARRASDNGDHILESYTEGSDEWITFSDAVWNYQFTETYYSLEDDIRHALYDESQGIPAIFVAIYKKLQQRIINDGNDLSVDLIRQIVPKHYPRLYRALAALRSGTARDIRHYEQMYFMDMVKPRREAHIPNVSNTTARPKKTEQSNKKRSSRKRSGPPPEGSLMHYGVKAELDETYNTDIKLEEKVYDKLLEAGLIADFNEYAA